MDKKCWTNASANVVVLTGKRQARDREGVELAGSVLVDRQCRHSTQERWIVKDCGRMKRLSHETKRSRVTNHVN